jgi:hypothetical protein
VILTEDNGNQVGLLKCFCNAKFMLSLVKQKVEHHKKIRTYSKILLLRVLCWNTRFENP